MNTLINLCLSQISVQVYKKVLINPKKFVNKEVLFLIIQKCYKGHGIHLHEQNIDAMVNFHYQDIDFKCMRQLKAKILVEKIIACKNITRYTYARDIRVDFGPGKNVEKLFMYLGINGLK